MWSGAIMVAEAPLANDKPTIRCAIYTRQSVERKDDFTSCDVQREACEAYVGSMRREGWCCLDECFDDVGESGGSPDRPALRRLLEAVIEGRVDAVVVHRFDRLTRSMADWIRLHDLFDAAGVKLVVVTGGHSQMGAAITDSATIRAPPPNSAIEPAPERRGSNAA